LLPYFIYSVAVTEAKCDHLVNYDAWIEVSFFLYAAKYDSTMFVFDRMREYLSIQNVESFRRLFIDKLSV